MPYADMPPVNLAPDRHPWARQPGEPTKWYDRFDRYYRTLGPDRSMFRAYCAFREDRAQAEGVPYGPPDGVSGAWRVNAARWRWSERASAWDDAQRRAAREAEADAIAEMNRRHLSLATGMQTAGTRRLKAMLEGDKVPEELDATEVRQYIKEGVTLERQARGLPEHLVAVSELSDDELLSRYSELLARAVSGAEDAAFGD